MNLSLQVLALLWYSLLTCDCAPLEVTIPDGSGSTSCVGDMVQYTCTVPAVTHAWMIPSLGFSETITRTDSTFPRPSDPLPPNIPAPFTITITVVGTRSDPITTALSMTSFAGLRGATITCIDPNQVVNDTQETTGQIVFDPPSAPGLTAVPSRDLVSFDFTITPSTLPDCVVNYTITATSSAGSRNITVPAGEVDGSTPRNVDGFSDVCTEDYTFTVAPVTIEGTGPSSASVDIAGVTEGITGLMANTTHLMWSAPTGVPETCFTQYIISLTANPTVNLIVNGTTVSSAALNVAGFPYCVSQEITVTPIVSVTLAPLNTSSATMQVVINDPEIGTVVPAIVVTSTGSLSATVSWEADEESRNRIVGIGRSVSSDCMNVRNVTEGTSTSVEFECDDNRQVVMPPCVQYFDGGCKSMIFLVTLENVVCPTPSEGTPIGGIVGGVIAAIVAVGLVMVIVIVIVFIKKKGGSDGSTDSAKPKETYHTSGATAGSHTAVTVEEQHAPGALYADPKAIEHETAGAAGDQYALITSNTKAKKKNGQAPPEPAPAAELGDMYSVPDKSKKQQNQNQGLVYADIDLPQRPPPRNQGSQKQKQKPDEEPVTYAAVTSPM